MGNILDEMRGFGAWLDILLLVPGMNSWLLTRYVMEEGLTI